MDNVLSRKTARALDAFTIDKGHSTLERLMLNAGRAVAIEAAKLVHADTGAEITIICGKGNNGGDGLAAAQFLLDWGYRCQVMLICRPEELEPVALKYHDEIKAAVINAAEPGNRAPQSNGLIVDALLGIGASGPLREPVEGWANYINACEGLVLSIDLPTGLDSDNGHAEPSAVLADMTVTLGFCKVGLLVNSGPDLAGKIVVADIGFSTGYFNGQVRGYYRFNHSDFLELFVPPERQTYKHKQGKTLVISGSRGMTGAASLANNATLCSGSGLTIAACPLSLQPLYASGMPEIVTLGLDDHQQGMFLPEHVPLVRESLEWCTALVMGPGLSRAPQCQDFVRQLLPHIHVPMILDADGLSPFNGKVDPLIAATSPIVITPHAGEFAMLFDHDRADIVADPVHVLDEVGSYFNHTVVLKGAPTLVLLSNGDIIINSSGNPGMATAGSGDVLSGIIGTFLSQGYSADHSAIMGVWLHGRAGDLAASNLGAPGLTAGDILHHVPLAIREMAASR